MKVSFDKMKRMALMLIAVTAIALNSCAVSNKSKLHSEADGLYGTKWKITELNGNPVPDLVNGKEPFMTFNKEHKTYSASGGCNGIGGEFEITANNKLKLSRGISTMMACTDMSVEQAIGQMIVKVDRMNVNKGTLLLLQGSTVVARMQPSQKVSSISDLEGTWQLDYIAHFGNESFKDLYPVEKPTITFNTAEKKVTGNSGCNNFFGSFKQYNNQGINFDPLGMTRKACPGNGESVFVQNLEKVNNFSIHENTLTLISGDIAIMRFQKK